MAGNGVTRIEIGIPGEARRGILSPEAFAVLKSSAGKADPFLEQALRTGDYAALRAMPPQDQDLTVEPIEETELLAKGSHGEIPVTLYRAAGPPGTRPALVYLHGGGFRMGSRRSTEHSMRLLAQYSSAAVFSVEYRLAPEHRFPCATDDAWNALRWVYRHAAELDVDRARILIGGDSAGGNLAAACARRDRNMRTGILKGQLLVYPVLSQCEPALPGYHFSAGDYEICEEQKQLIQTAVFSLKTQWTDSACTPKPPQKTAHRMPRRCWTEAFQACPPPGSSARNLILSHSRPRPMPHSWRRPAAGCALRYTAGCTTAL